MQQVDGYFGVIAVTHQGTGPNNQLLGRPVTAHVLPFGIVQSRLIQLGILVFDFSVVIAFSRIDELVIDEF